MHVLVLNCGSSSLKYQLFSVTSRENPHLLAKGFIERIGKRWSTCYCESKNDVSESKKEIRDHYEAIRIVIEFLKGKETGILLNSEQIDAVGHRVVHGGEQFCQSIRIDEKVMTEIEQCIELAPLHNPANLTGIRACSELLRGVPQVAVFDTAFHQSIPEFAWLYALPYTYYEKYKIRRYGFHGSSHKYVAIKAAQFFKKPLEKLNLITCHLGNGCSITAIKQGKSFDTSMGFTPLEGVIMGTRTGDLDPAIIFYIMEKEQLSSEEVSMLLNKKSGLLGVSGISNDMRDIEEAAKKGNKLAKLALMMFSYRIKKYIGAYTAALGIVDGLVFTGGIGENHILSRCNICNDLAAIGILLDETKNKKYNGKLGSISRDESSVKVLIIPT
ncbi:acetate/propionate family kinase, partial [Chlamydiota bacterium]